MIIINKTNAIFDEEDLKQAILMFDENPRKKYTISKQYDYHSIWVNGKAYSLHRLLGAYYFGNIDSFEIHHVDSNTWNNLKSNLLKCTHKEHMTLHRKYKDEQERREHYYNEEYREKYNQWRRDRYHNDEKFREAHKRAVREYLAKKKEQKKLCTTQD